MWNKIKQWRRGWEWLSIEQAEAETGIFGPIIAVSILGDKLKSLRRRDVERWAKQYGPSISPSLKESKMLPHVADELEAKNDELARLRKNDTWLNSAMDYLQAASLQPETLEWAKKSIQAAINSLKAAGVKWDESETK